MLIKVDETLRQRAKKTIHDLTRQLDQLNEILGPVSINETHKLLPGFCDALHELSKHLEAIIRARRWFEMLPAKEDLEGLQEIVRNLGAALHISERSSSRG